MPGPSCGCPCAIGIRIAACPDPMISLLTQFKQRSSMQGMLHVSLHQPPPQYIDHHHTVPCPGTALLVCTETRYNLQSTVPFWLRSGNLAWLLSPISPLLDELVFATSHPFPATQSILTPSMISRAAGVPLAPTWPMARLVSTPVATVRAPAQRALGSSWKAGWSRRRHSLQLVCFHETVCTYPACVFNQCTRSKKKDTWTTIFIRHGC